MDFLKTLLLYMTVTIAAGVQGGPLPEDVPVPTETPVIQAEQQTDAPEGMGGLQVDLPGVPTPTPAPTEVPEPTITPNKAYKNIEFGDRGNGVKQMQERLIELGYLPEDAADGAFGYQTSRAVRAFQKANGLHQDGVAGPATLTRLYEDPAVVPAVTAVPTEAPATQAPTEPAAIAPPEEKGEAPQPEGDAPEKPDEQPEELAEAPEEPAEADPASALGLTRVENAYIVMGASGTHLLALRLSDGVMVPFYPRVWLNGAGEAAVSLRDMADSVGAWVLQIEDGLYTLNAAGYTLELTVSGEGVACAVDGEAVELPEGAALAGENDVYVTEAFLRLTMNAQTLWDADESTLMLTVPAKEEALSGD